MKTIEEHLREALTPEQFAKAEKYRDEDWGDTCQDKYEALSMAFVWDETREGHDYWENICNQLLNKEQ